MEHASKRNVKQICKIISEEHLTPITKIVFLELAATTSEKIGINSVSAKIWKKSGAAKATATLERY